MTKLYDKQGHPVRLGAEIKRGGEGTVYEVEGLKKVVAKIYHATPSTYKSAKLAAMTALNSDRLQRVAAWPVDTLHINVGSNACGFLMPRISSLREVHELYGPKSRLSHFPKANWAFLNHTAANVARAFAGLHAQNLVIGDVNQSNLLVSEQGIVTLIDCDSFQITHQGCSYLCEVGVPTHIPPELQGKGFNSITRTANHDNFGLAIVIFQLLFLGRHPFSGKYSGTEEMPLERAISEFRFAYGLGAPVRQMKPPPGTLPFSVVSDPVSELFERAFSEEGAKPSVRPCADEWIVALTELGQNLTTCSYHTGHKYFSSLHSCPFCEVKTLSGMFHLVKADILDNLNKVRAKRSNISQFYCDRLILINQELERIASDVNRHSMERDTQIRNLQKEAYESDQRRIALEKYQKAEDDKFDAKIQDAQKQCEELNVEETRQRANIEARLETFQLEHESLEQEKASRLAQIDEELTGLFQKLTEMEDRLARQEKFRQASQAA